MHRISASANLELAIKERYVDEESLRNIFTSPAELFSLRSYIGDNNAQDYFTSPHKANRYFEGFPPLIFHHGSISNKNSKIIVSAKVSVCVRAN